MWFMRKMNAEERSAVRYCVHTTCLDFNGSGKKWTPTLTYIKDFIRFCKDEITEDEIMYRIISNSRKADIKYDNLYYPHNETDISHTTTASLSNENTNKVLTLPNDTNASPRGGEEPMDGCLDQP